MARGAELLEHIGRKGHVGEVGADRSPLIELGVEGEGFFQHGIAQCRAFQHRGSSVGPGAGQRRAGLASATWRRTRLAPRRSEPGDWPRAGLVEVKGHPFRSLVVEIGRSARWFGRIPSPRPRGPAASPLQLAHSPGPRTQQGGHATVWIETEKGTLERRGTGPFHGERLTPQQFGKRIGGGFGAVGPKQAPPCACCAARLQLFARRWPCRWGELDLVVAKPGRCCCARSGPAERCGAATAGGVAPWVAQAEPGCLAPGPGWLAGHPQRRTPRPSK